MGAQRQRQLLRDNAGAVIGNGYAALPAALDFYAYAPGAGIKAVFDKLLDNGCRPLNDLAGGDLVDQVDGQLTDGHGCSLTKPPARRAPAGQSGRKEKQPRGSGAGRNDQHRAGMDNIAFDVVGLADAGNAGAVAMGNDAQRVATLDHMPAAVAVGGNPGALRRGFEKVLADALHEGLGQPPLIGLAAQIGLVGWIADKTRFNKNAGDIGRPEHHKVGAFDVVAVNLAHLPQPAQNGPGGTAAVFQ